MRRRTGKVAGRALTAIVFLLVAVAVPGVYLAWWRAEPQPGRTPIDVGAEPTQVAALDAVHAQAAPPIAELVSDQAPGDVAKQARSVGATPAVRAPDPTSAEPAPTETQPAARLVADEFLGLVPCVLWICRRSFEILR